MPVTVTFSSDEVEEIAQKKKGKIIMKYMIKYWQN